MVTQNPKVMGAHEIEVMELHGLEAETSNRTSFEQRLQIVRSIPHGLSAAQLAPGHSNRPQPDSWIAWRLVKQLENHKSAKLTASIKEGQRNRPWASGQP